MFDDSGHIVGSQIDTCLLEMTRVVQHAEGEQFYHVFEHILGLCGVGKVRGAVVSDLGETVRTALHAGCLGNGSVEFEHNEKAAAAAAGLPGLRSPFENLLDTMATVGIDSSFKHSTLAIVVAVLALRQLSFTGYGEGVQIDLAPGHKSEGCCAPATEQSSSKKRGVDQQLQCCADLLETTVETVRDILVSRQMKGARESHSPAPVPVRHTVRVWRLWRMWRVWWLRTVVGLTFSVPCFVL